MEHPAADLAIAEPARLLLILDFDETLVLTVEQPLAHACDFSLDSLHVYKRPHVDSFIEECSTFCDLAIWSGGTADYIEPAVARLFSGHRQPVLVWSRRKCTPRIGLPEMYGFAEQYYLKDLKKIKRRSFDLRRVLIVEDQPRQVAKNYGNAIYVKPFSGDPLDEELLRLPQFIRSLNSCADVRRVEKRDWRSKVSALGIR